MVGERRGDATMTTRLDSQLEAFQRALIMARCGYRIRPLVYGVRTRHGRWEYRIVVSDEARQAVRRRAASDR